MIEVRAAVTGDVVDKVALESRLFAEDAGVHDPYGDVTWPERSGAGDFERLVADDDSIVLIACEHFEAVGFLTGYFADSHETRRPVRFGVLRSLYVLPTHRGGGVGRMLTERFVEWARAAGCVEAHVDHYAANHRAARLYESCEFEPRSVNRVRPLD